MKVQKRCSHCKFWTKPAVNNRFVFGKCVGWKDVDKGELSGHRMTAKDGICEKFEVLSSLKLNSFVGPVVQR